MQKYFLVTIITAWSLSLSAQSLPAPTQAPSKAAMQKAMESLSALDLKSHLTFLASDELEGRETGKHGQRVAAQYIASHFMRLGLKPGVEGKSYFQEFKVADIDLSNTDIKLGKEKFEYRKDYFSSDIYNTPEALTGDWLYVGYGLTEEGYDNLKGASVEGKNVLVLAGDKGVKEEMGVRGLIGKWMETGGKLREAGAKSVWMAMPDSIYDAFSVYGKSAGLSLISNEPPKAAVFIMNQKMANALLKAGNKSLSYSNSIKSLSASDVVPSTDFSKMKLQYAIKKNIKETKSSNVLGYLEGTDKKNELLVITAHYDHLGLKENGDVYNGADDDGSGTVTVLELAEAFSKAAAEGNRPRRSILFMTVSGEEKGLWGSEFYTDNPVYPLENTIADLNIDMIGRIDKNYEGAKDSANYTYLIGSDKLSSELDAINKKMNDDYTHLVLDYKYNDPDDPQRFYYRSDHYNFAKNGIPVIFYFTGVHKDYHQTTDDVYKINFNKMVTIGRLVFATAWELANREGRIVVDSHKE